LPTHSSAVAEPRKSPIQARSTASVEAILKATIQVLLRMGKDRLTTTRVAERAGVSVGTLYQYFPNKTALLRACLRRHMNEIATTVEAACLASHGQPVETMATTLVTTFLAEKMKDPKTSVALYAVSSDMDGMRIAREGSDKIARAIVAMLRTTPEPLMVDAETAASLLQGTMAGVSRRLVESATPERELEMLRDELVFVARIYLRGRSLDLNQPFTARETSGRRETPGPALPV
jgi:AcrR family transcriptional regulator